MTSIGVVEGGEALSRELADTAERLAQSVVQVQTERGGIGSGVLWQQRPATDGGDPEVLIVTNEHVVRAAGQSRLTVRTHDGRALVAEVFAHDPEHDLALMRTHAAGLRMAEAGDSAALRVGELVIAVGHPFGKLNTLTMGIVAARAPADPDISLDPADPERAPRTPEGEASPRERAARTPDLIQANLALYPGNSGGPLADARGRVVGINSMIGGGLAFAIPSRIVGQFITIAGVAGATRPRLGVEVLTVPLPDTLRTRAGIRADSAVMVAGMEPEGPAARAGVQIGDLLVGLDGRGIATARDLLVVLSRTSAAPGGKSVLTVVRAGQRKELALAFEGQPTEAAA
jgi:serine protease Do